MSRRRYFTPLPAPALPTEEISLVRIVLAGGVIALLFALLAGRLWLLQIVRGDEYRDKALLNRSRKVQTSAPRGIIVDSKGQILVTNSTQFAVYLHPEEVFSLTALLKIVDPVKPDKDDGKKPTKLKKIQKPTPKEKEATRRVQGYLDRVADLVDVPRLELDDTIRRKRGGTNDPIPIRENIDRRLMARLYERQDDLPGISVEIVPIRSYPVPLRATHLLGYTGSITAEELHDPKVMGYPTAKKYRSGDWIGKLGLEKTYDLYLRGTLGYEAFEVDGRGRRRKEVGREEAKPGAKLVLALDARVQEAAEKVLSGKIGAVVALNPRDGSVLAMASTPTYDLNLRSQRLTQQEYESKVGSGELNRVISAFPPGSTFKIVTATAGLAEGKITAETSFNCAGGKYIGKTWKRCHAAHGSVSLTAALALSCDTYFYSVGERLGPTTLAAWGHKFGIGEDLNLDMPVYGTSRGIMPDPEFKARKAEGWNRRNSKKMVAKWMGGDTANTSIGQGDVNISPLQMATVAATIANGGTVWEPRLVKSALAADDPTQVLYKMTPVVKSRLDLDSHLLTQVQRGMQACVEWGTGKGARVGGGIEVFGKSGSAEKRGGRDGGKGANYGWFTCYAQRHGEPASIAVCVFLEPTKGENYHGGEAAAPLARQVIEAHFAANKPAVALVTPSENALRRRRLP